jgi:hypothetical protein
MPGVIHWTEIANSDLQRMGRASVTWRKWLGMKSDHATEEAAGALGVSPRWMRSLVRDEPVSLRDRYDRFLARWWADMDRQAETLRQRAAEIEAQAEAARVGDRQLTLDLEAPCVEPSASASASGAPRARSGRPSA